MPMIDAVASPPPEKRSSRPSSWIRLEQLRQAFLVDAGHWHVGQDPEDEQDPEREEDLAPDVRRAEGGDQGVDHLGLVLACVVASSESSASEADPSSVVSADGFACTGLRRRPRRSGASAGWPWPPPGLRFGDTLLSLGLSLGLGRGRLLGLRGPRRSAPHRAADALGRAARRLRFSSAERVKAWAWMVTRPWRVATAQDLDRQHPRLGARSRPSWRSTSGSPACRRPRRSACPG